MRALLGENQQGVCVERKQQQQHCSQPHLTCGQTSTTSSRRFWLLCSPAESNLLRTTTCYPPAHPSLWQPPQKQQQAALSTDRGRERVNYRSISSLFSLCAFTRLWSLNHLKNLLFSPCPAFSLSARKWVTESKRITVTLTAKSCLAGINRATSK